MKRTKALSKHQVALLKQLRPCGEYTVELHEMSGNFRWATANVLVARGLAHDLGHRRYALTEVGVVERARYLTEEKKVKHH